MVMKSVHELNKIANAKRESDKSDQYEKMFDTIEQSVTAVARKGKYIYLHELHSDTDKRIIADDFYFDLLKQRFPGCRIKRLSGVSFSAPTGVRILWRDTEVKEAEQRESHDPAEGKTAESETPGDNA